MSEFHDVLCNTYGDPRTRKVNEAWAPYEAAIIREWRASHAATEVAELGLAASSVEDVPVIPQQQSVPLEEMGGTYVDGMAAVYSRP